MSVIGDARSKRYMIHEIRLKYDVDELTFRREKSFLLHTRDPQLNYKLERLTCSSHNFQLVGPNIAALRYCYLSKAQPTGSNARETWWY